MQPRVLHILVALLVLLGLATLAACSKRPTSANVPADAATTPATLDDFAATNGDADPVALAYDVADGSLLKAGHTGLLRWRAGSGWEKIALPASSVSAVVVNPEQPATVYAGGPEFGVLRSDDGGQSWQSASAGLPGTEVTALALHSFRRETLYAWVRNEGIYRTEDGGAAWKRVPDQGPRDTDVRGLTHSTLPGSMNTGWLYAATPSGAYLSMDCF